MGYKLSILIPTLASRSHLYFNLINELEKQDLNGVEVLHYLDDGEASIGKKRNHLLGIAQGEYICFIDDDDIPGKDYIKHIMEGINKGVDCVSLRGVITWDGQNPEIFEHSLRYNQYLTKEDAPCKFEQHSVWYSDWQTKNNINFDRSTGTSKPIKYERYPNHLNAIKASIAKQFKFPEINHGEDTAWAQQIHASGLIKTEHYVDAVTYHYQFVTKK